MFTSGHTSQIVMEKIETTQSIYGDDDRAASSRRTNDARRRKHEHLEGGENHLNFDRNQQLQQSPVNKMLNSTSASPVAMKLKSPRAYMCTSLRCVRIWLAVAYVCICILYFSNPMGWIHESIENSANELPAFDKNTFQDLMEAGQYTDRYVNGFFANASAVLFDDIAVHSCQQFFSLQHQEMTNALDKKSLLLDSRPKVRSLFDFFSSLYSFRQRQQQRMDETSDTVFLLCRNWLLHRQSSREKIRFKKLLKKNSTKILYYNTLNRERYICNHKIPPKEILIMKEPCYEVPKLFRISPNMYDNDKDNKFSIEPVVLQFDNGYPDPWFEENFSGDVMTKDMVNCDVPCFSYGEPYVDTQRFVFTIDYTLNRQRRRTEDTLNGENNNTSTTQKHEKLLLSSLRDWFQQKEMAKHNNSDPDEKPPSDRGKWTITFSMEGPMYYGHLYIRDSAYLNNRFYSTTSFQSEVPLPYFSFVEYNIQAKQPVRNTLAITSENSNNRNLWFDERIKGAAFLAKNCASLNNREKIVEELIYYSDQLRSRRNDTKEPPFQVDSLSDCLQNAEVPGGLTLADKKVDIISQYMFHLSFENQNVDDYITEKLWQSYEAGVIPVYYGAPNILEHVPHNSLIFVNDFIGENTNNISGVQNLFDYLVKVANDKVVRDSYLEWRYLPLSQQFQKKYEISHVHSTCRTCRWAYARMYGLGWNHEKQSISKKLRIGSEQQACFNKGSLLVSPFEERWISLKDIEKNYKAKTKYAINCSLNQTSLTAIKNQKQRIRRTVIDHDGLIDMHVEFLSEQEATPHELCPFVLRIDTKMNTEGTNMKIIEDGHIRIQNSFSRLSILFKPSSSIMITLGTTISTYGLADLHFNTSAMHSAFDFRLPVSLRFISEDIDTVHTDAYKYENFYGNLMKEDFFNPIETYVITKK